MEGATCVEGTDVVWPAPRFEAENEKLLLDAGATIVPVDIRGPFTEEAENTGRKGLAPWTCLRRTAWAAPRKMMRPPP